MYKTIEVKNKKHVIWAGVKIANPSEAAYRNLIAWPHRVPVIDHRGGSYSLVLVTILPVKFENAVVTTRAAATRLIG